METLKKYLPTIEIISRPGLRERHWERIQEVMGVKFNYKEESLMKLLNKNIEEYVAQIEEISEAA